MLLDLSGFISIIHGEAAWSFFGIYHEPQTYNFQACLWKSLFVKPDRLRIVQVKIRSIVYDETQNVLHGCQMETE